MMFADLKNQVIEKSQEAWAKIQDSPAYNTLREKYETLPPSAQKLIVFGSIGVAVLILISVPMGYLSSSSDNNAVYEDLRQTTRGLLRASRLAADAANIPQSMTADQVIGKIQDEYASFNLTPEQTSIPVPIGLDQLQGSFVKSNTILQEAVAVSLKKLNLKQIVDIGYRFQNINPGVKVAGLEIRAISAEPGYFDTIFKLVTFNVPQESVASPPSAGPGRSRTNPGRGDSANDPGATDDLENPDAENEEE